MPDSPSLTPAVMREVYRLESEPHLAPAADSFSQTSIVFGRVGTRELRADLFVPKAATVRPRPAVVYLHGGGWRGGPPAQFARHAAAMTAQGFVGLCVDYRGSEEASFPAALEDCKCAVRYLRAKAAELQVDSRRIGAVGGSAGAHLSAMLATTAGRKEWEGSGGWAEVSSAVQAAVLFNGEFDLPAWWRTGLLNECMLGFFGKSYEEAPDLYQAASPITHVDRRTPPCLLIHGEADTVVPIQQSVDFCDRHRAAGGRSELIRVPDVNHAWFNSDPHFQPCLRVLMDFLIKHLA